MPDIAFLLLDNSIPKVVGHALGKRITFFDFMRIGERITNLERVFLVKEGLTWDGIAPRFSTPQEGDSRAILSPNDLNEMMSDYYKVRGWDTDGKPKTEKLKTLGLEWCV